LVPNKREPRHAWFLPQRRLVQPDVVVLDDWGVATLDTGTRSDLLEVIDDRAAVREPCWATCQAASSTGDFD